MNQRVRRGLIGVLVAIVISGATVVVLEGAASALVLAHDFSTATAPSTMARPTAEYDTLLGWINRPDYTNPNEYGRGVGLSITSRGFRRISPAVSAPRARIVCTGDSYTAGEGVADDRHWCALLQRDFPGAQGFDMAEGAYGLDQAYLWYERDGLSIRPDIHVVALTAAEFDRTVASDFRGRFKPTLAVDGNRLVTQSVPVRVQTTSALNRVFAWRAFDDLRLMQLLRQSSRFDVGRLASERLDARWNVVEAILDHFATLDKTRGATVVFVYLPTARDLRPGPGDDRRRRIAEFVARRGIRFVDLTPALRAMRRDSSDLVFLSAALRKVPSSAVGQYSDLGHEWVAHSLAIRLDSLPTLAALRARAAPGRR